MVVKDIYKKAIQSVIDGKMSSDELWEIFEEHLGNKQGDIDRLNAALDNVRRKYNKLLELVANTYDEFKELIDKE